MYATKAGNPLSEPPQAASLTQAAILSECRELILDRLSESLAAVLEEIDGDLQEKRNKAGMNSTAQRYVDAQYYLRTATPNFEEALRRAFERSFRARLSPNRKEVSAYRDLVVDERTVTLVDETTMTESLAVKYLARKMGRASEGELLELQPRIAGLLNLPDGEPANDPLGPEALCEAFKDVCWDLGSSLDVRTLMLEQLTERVSGVLKPVYHELNQFLESRDVKRPARRVRRGSGGGRSGSGAGNGGRTGTAPAPSAGAESGRGAASASAQRPPAGENASPVSASAGEYVSSAASASEGNDGRGEVIRQLLSEGQADPARVLALQEAWRARQQTAAGEPVVRMPEEELPTLNLGDADAWPMAANAGILAGGVAVPTPAAGFSSTQVLDMLSRLQRGEPASLMGSGGRFDFRPAGDGSAANVLKPIVDSGLLQQLEMLDGIIIDVVASLFDRIFDDESVPSVMKGLIGRLQIPVVKLAMIDHGLLANRAHPARVLINRLAHASATWDGELDTVSPLFVQAAALIHRIQEEFDQDPGVFSESLEVFEAFLAEAERRADEEAAHMAAELERKEQEEIALCLARGAVAVYVEDETLPDAVRAFLEQRWQVVLELAALEQGNSSGEWQEALRTMERLVWSVRPKQGPAERQRLIDELPLLLRGLRGGLEHLEALDDEQEGFFTTLVALHAAAVKAGMPVVPLRVELPSLAELHELEVGPFEGRGDAVSAMNDVPASEGLSSEKMRSPLESLKRGDWLDLIDGGSARHVRLTWISPARTTLLFANRQGEKAMALSRDELEARFANGTAVLALEQPLVDRIVDELLLDYAGTEV